MSMTESEAIEHLKYRIATAKKAVGNGISGYNAFLDMEMAISALEKVQKIKELGDCYIIPKNSTWEVNGIDIHKALEEIQQYVAIGTVSDFRELKEKATAKPIKGRKFIEAICPHCESEIFDTYWAFGGIHYCTTCGSAIDWSEGKER